MRYIVGLFGLIGGGIIIWNVSRYGFQLSDNDADGYMWGAIYGGVTLVGIGGFAFGSHLEKTNLKKFSRLVYGISFVALIVSLSNAHGAMVGRTDAKQAARIKNAEAARIARRVLEGDQKELTDLKALKLEPATSIEVDAAKKKADEITRAREAECSIRGRECKKKEDAEGRALSELAEASKRKTTTERIKVLEDDIKAQGGKIDEAGPVFTANIQGASLVRVFGLDDNEADRASALQNLIMALLWEVAVATSLWGYELLGSRPIPVVDPVKPVRLSRTRAPKSEPKTIERAIEADAVVSLPKPARTVIATKKAKASTEIGDITQWYRDCVDAKDGACVQAATFRASYEAWCRARGKKAAGPKGFGQAISKIGVEKDVGAGNVTFYYGIVLKKASLAAVV